MALNKAVLVLARAISDSLLEGYNDYLAECERYRKDGYRPHYCEHGTNLWTDYDNICGGCEDGMSMGDGVQRREFALDSAKRRWADCRAIAEHVAALRALGVDCDWEPAWSRMSALLKVDY